MRLPGRLRRLHARPWPATSARRAVLAVSVGVAACGAGDPLTGHGERRDHVVGTVDRPLSEVEAQLAADGPRALQESPKLRSLRWVRADDPVAPPPDQLRLASERDPALAAYAALDAAERRHDFYQFDLADAYWPSGEYSWRGRPAPFKTDFFVHLGSDARGATSVEVIEYRPRVRLGERFFLFGHHGPGFYEDIRFVAPTTDDRQELLARLLRLFPAGAGTSGALPLPAP